MTNPNAVTRETVGLFYNTNHQAHLAVESGLTKDEFIRSLLAENERLMDVVMSIKRNNPLTVKEMQ